MALSDAELDLETKKLELEERRVKVLEDISERPSLKAKILNSTVIVAFISISVPLTSWISELYKTRRTEIIAQQKFEIENAAKATQVYFTNVDAFSCSIDGNSNLAINRLKLLEASSGSTILHDILRTMQADCAPRNQDYDQNTGIAFGLPAVSNSEELELASSYTVFVQYPPVGSCKSLAEMLQNSLFDIGFRTPGIQAIEGSPNIDQVRFYTQRQKDSWENRLTSLQMPNNQVIDFSTKLLTGNLPNDVFEVWIGKENACADQ